MEHQRGQAFFALTCFGTFQKATASKSQFYRYAIKYKRDKEERTCQRSDG
jgi:hypothetical protein